jgi:hypothetical protein
MSTTNITDFDGKVVEVTRTNGKVNAGRLFVESGTLKLKNPDGGRGRPVIMTLSEVESFIVLDATKVSTNGTKPAAKAKVNKAKVNKVKVPKSDVKPTPVPPPVQTVDDEENDETPSFMTPVPVTQEQVDALKPGAVKRRSLKLKVTRPVRRCPLTGNPITKENGVAITFFENGEERKFYFERVAEVADFITVIRPDVAADVSNLEEEEDDE